MFCIQNSYIGRPSPFNKAIAGCTCVLVITVIALSIIGLTATPSGPFNAIVQFGKAANGILLGTSIFAFILDIVWIATLCKQTKEQSVSRSGYSQPRPFGLGLPNPESLKQEFSQSVLVSTSEEINDTDFLSQQSEEIILKIFGYLSVIELAKCGEVSRKWRRLACDATLWNAFDLRTISPSLKVFDELDWVTHVDLSSFGLDVTDAPPLDKRQAIPFLKRCLSSLPIEGNAGVTLLTIPKGLTFNTLVKLAGSPKVGNAAKFGYIWDRISSEIGDIPVDRTYRIVITNNVFKKSRHLSVSDQKALMSKIGCEKSKVLEATVLLVVTFMVSGERLYSDNPWTYTRCSEQIAGYQLVVGGFSPNGVYIDSYGFDIVSVSIGVGGVLRKFQVIGN